MPHLLPGDATIVFDLDGTIVDTAPDLIGTLNHVLTGAGCRPLPPATARPLIAYGARRMIEHGLRAAGRDPGPSELDDLLELFLSHYSERIADASRPFPGVVAALERIAGAGAKLGVCTNKLEGLSRKLLRALDLERYFGAVVGRDTLAVCKPHPGHLTGTVERLGGRAERTVMVGDSAVDIETARAAGAPVVAVSFGYTSAPIASFSPDRIIDHFDELEASLCALLGGQARS